MRHHAVHDAEGFAAGDVSLQQRDPGLDPPSRRLDVCETFLRDLAPPNASQSGRQPGLRLRPFVVSQGEIVQGGPQRRGALRGFRERLHAALDPSQRDVRAELLDLLSGQRIGENARHAALGVGRDPVAGRVVADGEGADVAVVKVGKPFVEVRRLVRGAIVAVFEASFEVELQTGLETEGDVAKTAQRLRSGIDEEHRDREQLAFDAVDARRDGLARRDGKFEASARSHRRGAVGDCDALGFVAGVYWDRDPFHSREATPVDRVARGRLRRLAARFRRLPRLGQEDGIVEARLGHVVAPGDTRLQFACIARQQHSQAERGRFERTDGRPFGRAIIGCGAFSGGAVLHAFAAALGFEQVLGGFLVGGVRAGDGGGAACGTGLSTGPEIAGQIPVGRARTGKDFACEIRIMIWMRAGEIAAHEVNEAPAHDNGRARLWQLRERVKLRNASGRR